MDLDSVADELYGLPPGEFTATRNARAKQARADGDRELAEGIRRLAKPTTAAWLVNRMARELGEELEPLADLGRDLRGATSRVSGEELRALTRQRHEVVQALVQQARRVGAAHGSRVSESVATEVQRTLDASLADPQVAEAVLSGRLTHAVEYAGFGQPAGTDWSGSRRRTTTAGPDRPRKGSDRPRKGSGRPEKGAGRGSDRKVADLAARRRESARRALSEAEEDLRAARSDHDAATSEQEEASATLESAQEAVEQLRADLDAAREQSRSAGRAERAARERTRRAEHAVRKAEQAREVAAGRLAELED